MATQTQEEPIPPAAPLVNTTITVTGSKDGVPVPIKLHIKVVALTYGPVIDISIRSSVPYIRSGFVDWTDHPFLWVEESHLEKGKMVGNIIDDTPATRALIDELIKPEQNLYTTTNCSHKGRLIRALCLFWS